MKCLVCDSDFNEVRYLKDLFRVKKYYICLKCMKQYPLSIRVNHIPLNNHLLDIIYLFDSKKRFKYEGYIKEFSEIYKKLIEINKDKLVLFSEYFYLNDRVVEGYNHISTLLDKDIILLTNVLLV